ncbi:LCP family protein [Gleimia hominis]|uniref:LCP family protein n=1 Tax=Gleimia hominis TaxID=595468 RepID=UPI000C807CC8|nr:LCP family protein [Gleimia hominis]WIK64760.1 LCP family protein [Gleimia hominis]
MANPPSFNPKDRRARPSSSGAKRVSRRSSTGQPRPSKDRDNAVRRSPSGRSSSSPPARDRVFTANNQARLVRRQSVFHQNQTGAATDRSGAAAPDRNYYREQAARREGASAREAIYAPQPPSYAPSVDRRRSESTDVHREYSPQYNRGYQPQYSNPPSGPSAPSPAPVRRRRPHRGRRVVLTTLLVLVLLVVAWPAYLAFWASTQISHVDALSSAPAQSGTTYLLAGSDSRDGATPDDGTEGGRTDTILLLRRAANGQTSLVSLPRDTWVSIPGHNQNKLNAAYSLGGPSLMVETVEGLTGLKVDRYVEIGMDGLKSVVDAVGGVNLCLDYDVNDHDSQLVWKSGCHRSNGDTALAFARMRMVDPEGDIGRAKRQRQVISAISSEIMTPSLLLNPFKQRELVGATAHALTTDTGTGSFGVARLAWDFRSVMKSDLNGAPPIARINLPTYAGSAVQLDEERAPSFFEKMKDGTLTQADLNQVRGVTY